MYINNLISVFLILANQGILRKCFDYNFFLGENVHSY